MYPIKLEELATAKLKAYNNGNVVSGTSLLKYFINYTMLAVISTVIVLINFNLTNY